MRDLVLAKQYCKDNVIFTVRDLKGNINQRIIEENYKIEILESNDFEELNNLIQKLKIDMIVIDHYKIDYDFEKRLKELNPKLVIMVLDDTYEKHCCDILLNHNINATQKRYKNLVPKHCELRCGSQYTLLRDEFLEAKNQKIKKEKKTKKIFIAMGGADHSNINIDILKTLKRVRKNNEYKIKVNIVTTYANKNLEALKKYCKNKKWVNLHINSNKIAKLMIQSDFAIVTPSVTVNEIYYLEIPFIAIKTADNQKELFKYLKSHKYMVLSKLKMKKLHNSINKMIHT